MPDSKTSKPSTIVVPIAAPFGGWIPTPTGTGTTNLAASMEGNIGPVAAQGAGQQYAQSTAISLFRLEKYGHIAPGDVFAAQTDATPLINQLALNAAVDSGSNAWYILKNGRLVVGSSTAPTTAYDPTLAAPNHSGETIVASRNPDMIVMKDLDTTPVEWVVWSWESNVSADIAIMQTNGSGENDDWFSTLASGYVLKKGVPLKIVLGPDDNLYVTNGNKVQQVNIIGSLSSATLGTNLVLGPGWIASGICVYKNYVAIIAYTAVTGFTGVTRGQCRVFMWDGITDSFGFSYDIPDNYANGIYFDGNDLYAFTNGRNNSSKIWIFNGSNFVQKFESSLIGTSTNPIQGSFESYQEGLLIAANGKNIYEFLAGGFHDRAIATDGTFEATDIGFVKNLFQGELYMGVAANGGYKIYYQNSFSNYYTPADFRTQLFTKGLLGRRMVPLPFKGTVTRIQIFLSQFGTAASFLLSLFRGYDTFGIGGANDKLNLLIDTNTANPNSTTHRAYPTGTYEMDITDMVAITDISSFYMNIRFNHASVSNVAAIITRMMIFVEPSQ